MTERRSENEGADGSAAAGFRRLLVPVDFSAASRAAFALASAIAQRWNSEIVAFNTPGADANDEFLGATGIPWGKSDVNAEAQEHLRDFTMTVAPESVDRVRLDVSRDDDMPGAVARACERHDASLVVLGVCREAWPRWRRAAAERIVRAIPRPVLLVPAPPRSREGAAGGDRRPRF